MSTLEHELADVLRASRLGPRQAQAVARRFGWDGRPPGTLAEAGANAGYTRERVRQLEQRARRHAAGLELPAAREALRLVVGTAPAPRTHIALRLAIAGIAERPFDPAGVLVAAKLTGVRNGLDIHDGYVIDKRDAQLATRAGTMARRQVTRRGAAYVPDVAGLIGARERAVRRVLAVAPDVTWLGDDWLFLPVARDRVSTGIRKMLSVAGRLTLAELEDGLRRPGCDVRLPRSVLRARCLTLDWVSMNGDVVSPRVTLEADRLLSPIERTLVAIFRAEGSALGFSRAVQLGVAAGLNPTSAAIYLGKTPVLRTVSRGVYALRA
jgi:sigma-70-like protein